MRKSFVLMAAGVLVACPLVGNVQQVPGEVTQRPLTVAELQNLVSTQTDAILALRKRLVDLETRVKKLEDSPAAGSNR